jgi:hypothetical protein
MTLSTVVKDCFSGRWRIERKITDLRDGEEGVLTGWAAFDPKGRSIIYSAEGKLKMRGEVKTVTEFHRIEFVAPGRVEVFFDDGEMFHHFDPRADGPTAEHRHEGELYRVAYDFRRPWEWSMTVHITGPKRDLRGVTRFTR